MAQAGTKMGTIITPFLEARFPTRMRLIILVSIKLWVFLFPTKAKVFRFRLVEFVFALNALPIKQKSLRSFVRLLNPLFDAFEM